MSTMILMESLADAKIVASLPYTEVEVEALRVELIKEMLATSLVEYRRLQGFEESLCRRAAPGLIDHQLRDLTWESFAAWLGEARPLYDRIHALENAARQIPMINEFDGAIGMTMARLSVTPDQTRRGIEQLKRGEFIPARELRNELHARIRT